MNLTNLLNFQSKIVEDTQINSYKMTEFVANSLRVIIEDFFMKLAPSFVIVVSSRGVTRFNFYLIVLQYIFNIVGDMNIQLVFIDREKPRRIEGPRLYNILLIDSFESFLDIDVISYTKDYDTNEYYHMFLMQKDRFADDDMRRIFSYCWNHQIINCNIQFQNAQGELHLYTYFPYGRDNCGNTAPERVNQFVGDKWMRQPYFLDKVTNFHGCILAGVVRHAPPYAFMDSDKEKAFKGLEIEMVTEMARALNFSLALREVEEDDRTFPQKRGGLTMLDERAAHFVFGYYRKRVALSDAYTTTAPHFQSYMVCVINVRAHTVNTFGVLSFPFHPYTWFAILACFTLILTITRIAHSREPTSMRTFSMVACTFGIPIKDKPKYLHSFLMFTPWLWCAFLLRSIYSGLLYHLFSNDIYQPLPKSIFDAVNQGYTSVMNNFTFNDVQAISLYNRNEGGKVPVILNSSNELIALEYLEEHTSENVFAVISAEFLTLYMDMHGKHGLFYTIPESIMQQQLCLYLTKHSFLIHQFDRTIMELKATGLLKFWMNRYLDAKALSNSIVDEDKMIEQHHLWGIYMICGVLYLVALVVFVLELLSVKMKRIRNLFE